MSYCRFAWDGSDVYVIQTEAGFNCCGCHLNEGGFTTDTRESMILHLVQHKKAGQFVPPYAIERLWQEIEGPNEPVHTEPEIFRQLKERLP